MNYIELLNSKEWHAKRLEILKRDDNECQRCGASKTSNNASYGATFSDTIILENVKDIFDSEIKIVKFYDSEDQCDIFCKTSIKTTQIHLANEASLIINFVAKDKYQYPFNGAIDDNIKSSFFHSSHHINKEFIELIKSSVKSEVDITRFDIDKEGFYFSAKSTQREYVKSDNLHVHHKCYRKNIEMWNQPNDEYITLCNVCHRIVHENQMIPYFNERGEIYQYMKPCWKCGGQRYLECYKHVNNGVCYACNGHGYQMR